MRRRKRRYPEGSSQGPQGTGSSSPRQSRRMARDFTQLQFGGVRSWSAIHRHRGRSSPAGDSWMRLTRSSCTPLLALLGDGAYSRHSLCSTLFQHRKAPARLFPYWSHRHISSRVKKRHAIHRLVWPTAVADEAPPPRCRRCGLRPHPPWPSARHRGIPYCNSGDWSRAAPPRRAFRRAARTDRLGRPLGARPADGTGRRCALALDLRDRILYVGRVPEKSLLLRRPRSPGSKLVRRRRTSAATDEASFPRVRFAGAGGEALVRHYASAESSSCRAARDIRARPARALACGLTGGSPTSLRAARCNR